MGWFWAVQDLEDVTPDGGGICGGVTITADLLSNSVCETSLTPRLILRTDALSDSILLTELRIDGWGLRDLESLSRSESGLDIGNGLQVYGDLRLLQSNVNILRFGGELLAASTTINQNEDVVIISTPEAGDLDGGSAISGSIREPLDGGDAYNDNQEVDGGDADRFELATGGTGGDTTPYSQEVDIVSDYLIYKGWALPGGVVSDPIWRIQEIVIDINGDVSKRYADGNDLFDNIWNNRAILTYA